MGIEGRKKKKELTGFEDPEARNLKAKYEKPTTGSVHFTDLHDEQEDRAGQKFDESTGERIDNTQDVGHELLSQIEIAKIKRKAGNEDLLGDIADDSDSDPAAAWLRKHGGEGEGRGK